MAVEATKHGNLEISKITVSYLDRNHHRPQKLHFYPYQRISNGDRVEFKLRGGRRVIGVKVMAWGWSGSHAKDGFRIVLKKNIHRPPVGWVQTGYFYGQCIGGDSCPGYRQNPTDNFSIDFKDVVEIKKIHFFAHDNVGNRHKARIHVYVDDQLVARNINIKSRGSEHTITLDPIYGRVITFKAINDEATVQRITVDYSAHWDRGSRSPGHRGRPDRGRRHGRPFNR